MSRHSSQQEEEDKESPLVVKCVVCGEITPETRHCAKHLLEEEKLYISKSTIPEAGRGLFTSIDRRPGDYICKYEGNYIRFKKNESMEALDFGGDYVLQLNKTTFIDASDPNSGPGRFANNCRKSNINKTLRVKGNNSHFTSNSKTKQAYIKATKFIPANSEIFVAYGNKYW
jgi:hypothetical protein